MFEPISAIIVQCSSCVFQLLQCSGELATAVIGYLYTGNIKSDAGTAAEIIMLANLWQLPGELFRLHTLLPLFQNSTALSDTTTQH